MMNLNKRITRKYFQKLGLFSGGSVIAGYYTNKGFTGKSSAVTSKLETRQKAFKYSPKRYLKLI